MSEKVDSMLGLTESFSGAYSSSESSYSPENSNGQMDLGDASKIFELINQLNDTLGNEKAKLSDNEDNAYESGDNGVNENNSSLEFVSNLNDTHELKNSHSSSSSSEYSLTPGAQEIQGIENSLSNNSFIINSNNNNNDINYDQSNKIPPSDSNQLFTKSINEPKRNTSLQPTRIPRIPFLHRPSTNTNATNSVKTSISNTIDIKNSSTCVSPTPTVSSICSNEANNSPNGGNFKDENIIQNGGPKSSTPTNRPGRSMMKSADLTSNKVNTINNNYNEQSNVTKNTSKRGISLSAATFNKSNRSLNNCNGLSQENLNGSFQLSNEPAKNVKYIVKHKPRESQVKIFSQKVEIKNVGSKIKSLEKASYTPSGGNVKIENRKLNWNAQSKIGSLEYANYQPKGGNVKIESRKLDFKEKARPRTDTGLIVIEAPLSKLSTSSSLSNEQLEF